MPTYIRVKDLPNAATSPAADDFILLSGAANGARRISRADFLAAVAGFYTSDPSTYKLATLDAGNKVLVSQLPSSAFSYQGTWAASTNTPTLANGTGTGGDTYYASDSGSVDFGAGSISFLAGDAVVYDGSVWQKVPDVVNLLDGKGTLDEAKATLEIPDVGSNPDEVSLNGMLGSMAYQSAEAVSVDRLEVTDKVDGSLGVGVAPSTTVHLKSADPVIRLEDSSPDGVYGQIDGAGGSLILTADGGDGAGSSAIKFRVDGATAASDKVTIDSSGNVNVSSGQIQVISGAVSAPSYAFDGDTDTGMSRPTTNAINFVTGGTERWRINASGNLVANGTAIDFGSTNTASGVTVNSSVMSDYEVGTWTPDFTTSGSGFTTPPTMNVFNARYVRVGDMVTFTCYLETDSVDLTGAGTYLLLTGLPYAASASSGYNFSAINVGFATRWANAPAGGYIQTGTAFIYLTKRTSSVTGDFTELSPSDLTAGTTADQNRLMISGSYVIA